MQLEPNEVRLRATPACHAAQIMLPAGPENRLRLQQFTLANAHPPAPTVALQRGYFDAAPNLTSSDLCAQQHRFIQNKPGKGECAKRQRYLRNAPTHSHSYALNGDRTQLAGFNANLFQIFKGLATEELAAHFGMRRVLPFHQHHAASGVRQANRGHRSCGTSANDQMLQPLARKTHAFLRITHNRAGVKPRIATSSACSPAALHRRRQSSAKNARAMETGPSCCTKGWSPIPLEKTRKR